MQRRVAALLKLLDTSVAQGNTGAVAEVCEALVYLCEATAAVADLPKPEPWSDDE